jgi:hypothetical protein
MTESAPPSPNWPSIPDKRLHIPALSDIPQTGHCVDRAQVTQLNAALQPMPTTT